MEAITMTTSYFMVAQIEIWMCLLLLTFRNMRCNTYASDETLEIPQEHD